MKKYVIFCLCLLLLLFLLVGCKRPEQQGDETESVNATEHGLSVDNDGKANSAALQALLDNLSPDGGVIYIPSGEYEFAENGSQTIGSHCIKMRSGVSIVGDGEKTVLKPTGHSLYGLDMFYFNDYLDTKEAVYLEGCRFENFVIDASLTSTEVYTSAGKGFMFNLFKDCHWKGVTVKNTDATGFGVDCPIDSTMTDCTAIGCGKAATLQNGGASGFGIGYGFSEGESILITDCIAENNKKFGFFFEHQGRFNSEMYNAPSKNDFKVTKCTARGNYYGFGGICLSGVTYERCTSEYSVCYGFFFEDSERAEIRESSSRFEGKAAFAVEQTEDAMFSSFGISFLQCTAEDSPIALYIDSKQEAAAVEDVRMQDCKLVLVDRAASVCAHVRSLTLTDNVASVKYDNFLSRVDLLVDEGNSWNRK